jgi:iduronate 2-sulfatase
LKDGKQSVRDHAYHCFPKAGRLGRAIRTDRYRLVEWKPTRASGPLQYELYDYRTDPRETKNIAAENEPLVRQLADRLATHPPAKPNAQDRKPNAQDRKPNAQDRKPPERKRGSR